MRIVFHGLFAATFADGIEALLPEDAQLSILPDDLASDRDRECYAAADVIISPGFKDALPRPLALSLLHVPGAGYDAVDFSALPPSAIVCNCFGHEQAMAEYVMATLLARTIPFVEADSHLRHGRWVHRSGPVDTLHGELGDKVMGLLGFGHIGQAVAARAKAFGMTVHVANRSPVAPSATVDRAFGLDRLHEFLGTVDVVVVSVPLVAETTGMVDAAAFAAMRPDAVLVNVARGPVVDEKALYDALKTEAIGGAIIDTWYRYPSAEKPDVLPATEPLHTLPNILMTPHMSGWTDGMRRRRQRLMADNIGRRLRGEDCINQIWPT